MGSNTKSMKKRFFPILNKWDTTGIAAKLFMRSGGKKLQSEIRFFKVEKENMESLAVEKKKIFQNKPIGIGFNKKRQNMLTNSKSKMLSSNVFFTSSHLKIYLVKRRKSKKRLKSKIKTEKFAKIKTKMFLHDSDIKLISNKLINFSSEKKGSFSIISNLDSIKKIHLKEMCYIIERKRDYKNKVEKIKKKLRKRGENCNSNLVNLQKIFNILNELFLKMKNSMQNETALQSSSQTQFELTNNFERLNRYKKEYKKFGLDGLFIALVLPKLQLEVFSKWKPYKEN